jgi:sialate O-acetylesterase
MSLELKQPQAHAVIQRDSAGSGNVDVVGEVGGEAGAEVTATLTGRSLPGGKLEAGVVGKVTRGKVQGCLKGVPVGGPYRLEVRVGAQKATVADLLVGDLFILAGQSNMDGCGKLVDTEPPSRRVRCFYYDDRWATAEDPLCRYNEAADPVHWGVTEEDLERAAQADRDFRVLGAGLGVRFGKEIARSQGVPVGLLACSHGGTSLGQWSPGLLGEGGRSLYGSMVRRVVAAGGKARACLWYQGESDAATEDGLRYRENLVAFIEAMRRDLRLPKLPFIQVQLAPWLGDAAQFPHWNKVQTDQIAVEGDLPAVATVAAVDLSVSDAIHVDTSSMRRLGVRMAQVAEGLVYGDKAKLAGPRLKSARVSRERMTVELRFSGVNGGLRPRAGIQGFSLEAQGQAVALPERTVTAPDRVVLGLREPLAEGAVLRYGWGVNPVVSLSDEADLPCPVFGPVEL